MQTESRPIKIDSFATVAQFKMSNGATTYVQLHGIARERVPGRRRIVDWPQYLKFGEQFFRRGGLNVDVTNPNTGARYCSYLPCHHQPKNFAELAEVAQSA